MADTDHSGKAPAVSLEQVESQLAVLRQGIDAVDTEIVDALNRRARLAMQVGEVKKQVDMPVYRPEREAQIMTRRRARTQGPLGGDASERSYRGVVSACRGAVWHRAGATLRTEDRSRCSQEVSHDT